MAKGKKKPKKRLRSSRTPKKLKSFLEEDEERYSAGIKSLADCIVKYAAYDDITVQESYDLIFDDGIFFEDLKTACGLDPKS